MMTGFNNITGKSFMNIEPTPRKTVKTANVITSSTGAAAGTDFQDILNQASRQTYTQTQLDDIFQRAAGKYDISLELLKAVAKAESDFDVSCVSSSGAMGVMQLMPETAKELGVTDAYDPEQNIMGGAKYLSDKLKEYDGDISLALAAYNAGSGNVRKYGGIPPFTETQNYVKKILGYLENGF